MGELGEYFRDYKAYKREQKEIHMSRIAGTYNALIKKARIVGDHHRIGDWDFWATGTVRNIKTGEKINFKKLLTMVNI